MASLLLAILVIVGQLCRALLDSLGWKSVVVFPQSLASLRSFRSLLSLLGHLGGKSLGRIETLYSGSHLSHPQFPHRGRPKSTRRIASDCDGASKRCIQDVIHPRLTGHWAVEELYSMWSVHFVQAMSP